MGKLEWGVVEKLEVQADTRTSLLAALTIAMTYRSSLWGYQIKVKDGVTILRLRGSVEGGTAFLAPLNSPEEALVEAERWLAVAKYPDEPHCGDGSYKKGFTVIAAYHSIWDEAIEIIPTWIYYGK